MAPDKNEPAPVVEEVSEPQTRDDFIRRAWTLHVRGEYEQAEADFRKAIEIDPDSVEGYYGLGMSLKIQRRVEDSIKAFEAALEKIKSGATTEDPARTAMLRHMSGVQIMLLKKGDTQEPSP